MDEIIFAEWIMIDSERYSECSSGNKTVSNYFHSYGWLFMELLKFNEIKHSIKQYTIILK